MTESNIDRRTARPLRIVKTVMIGFRDSAHSTSFRNIVFSGHGGDHDLTAKFLALHVSIQCGNQYHQRSDWPLHWHVS